MKANKIILITLLIWCFLTSANSQDIDSIKSIDVKWVNSARMGMVFDTNSGLTGRLSTRYVTGIKINKIVAGIGVGVDDYEHLFTAPVFFELKYNAFNSENSIFIYAQGGFCVPFKKRSYGVDTKNQGINMGVGFGYEWEIDGVNLFCKSGFQMQDVTSEPQIYYNNFWYNDSIYPQSGTEITRKMGRAIFLIGINF
ncbi:MAG: hypothetical protein OEW67_05300 [Cyclobacteriaceae bacterium]|nr:hypothetical protein [Cyclobacteriaceae bacterium]